MPVPTWGTMIGISFAKREINVSVINPHVNEPKLECKVCVDAFLGIPYSVL